MQMRKIQAARGESRAGRNQGSHLRNAIGAASALAAIYRLRYVIRIQPDEVGAPLLAIILSRLKRFIIRQRGWWKLPLR